GQRQRLRAGILRRDRNPPPAARAWRTRGALRCSKSPRSAAGGRRQSQGADCLLLRTSGLSLEMSGESDRCRACSKRDVCQEWTRGTGEFAGLERLQKVFSTWPSECRTPAAVPHDQQFCPMCGPARRCNIAADQSGWWATVELFFSIHEGPGVLQLCCTKRWQQR